MLRGRIDWLWPSLGPLPSDYQAKTEHRRQELRERIQGATRHNLDKTPSQLTSVLLSQIEDEDSRSREVGGKLSTIAGYLPVAASIVLALMAVANADLEGRLQGGERYVAALAIVIAVYVFLQIVLSYRAALGGLERKRYPTVGLDTRLPRVDESKDDFELRSALAIADAFLQTREINNAKVSQMAVAHRALKNAVWGLLAMCLVMSGLLVARIFANPPTADDGSQPPQLEKPAAPVADHEELQIGPAKTYLDTVPATVIKKDRSD